MSERSATYYYYNHIRFAGDMADGRIPKKFRRHPKLSDFVAVNCCRNSGTLSQIFCCCFKWLDIAEFLKPPVLHRHMLYARDHLTYKDFVWMFLLFLYRLSSTLVIYHHHDLNGHYHLRALIPLPPLASNIIGFTACIGKKSFIISYNNSASCIGQSQKSIAEKSRSIFIGMRPISLLFPIFRRTVARRK